MPRKFAWPMVLAFTASACISIFTLRAIACAVVAWFGG